MVAPVSTTRPPQKILAESDLSAKYIHTDIQIFTASVNFLLHIRILKIIRVIR